MKLEIKDNRVTLRLSLQDQAAAAAAASAAKAEKALSNIYTSPATGTEITFDRNKVYHLPASPGTGPITQRADGAIFGLSQKIYHQDDTIPSLPETWVRMGGSYDTGQLNTIFVEWISPERQEYWILKDNPISAEDVATAKALEAKLYSEEAVLARDEALSATSEAASNKTAAELAAGVAESAKTVAENARDEAVDAASKIGPFESSFITSKNFLDKSKNRAGSYSLGGNFIPSLNWISTAIHRIPDGVSSFTISCDGGGSFASTVALVLFYDENGTFISSILNGEGLFPKTIQRSQIPSGATHWGFNLRNSLNIGVNPADNPTSNSLMLRDSSTSPEFEPYGALLDPKKIYGPIPGVAKDSDLKELEGEVGLAFESLNSIYESFDVNYRFNGSSSHFDLGKRFLIKENGDFIEIVSRWDGSTFSQGLSLLGVLQDSALQNTFGYYNASEIRLREIGSSEPWIVFSGLSGFGDFNRIRLEVISGKYNLFINNELKGQKDVSSGLEIRDVGRGYNTSSYFLGAIKTLSVKSGEDEMSVTNFLGPTSVDVELVFNIPIPEVAQYPDFFYEFSPTLGTNGVGRFTVYTKRKGTNDVYVAHHIERHLDMSDVVYVDYWRNRGAYNFKFNGNSMVSLGTQALLNVENEFTMLCPNKADHTGGTHGDETTVDVVFIIDGEMVNLSSAIPLTACQGVRYQVISNLHETAPTGGDPVPGHPIIAEHVKTVTFENGGWICRNRIESRVSNLEITRIYTGLVCNHKHQATFGFTDVDGYLAINEGNNSEKLKNKAGREFFGNNPDTGLSSYVASRCVYPQDLQEPAVFYINDRPNDSKYYRWVGPWTLNTGDSVIVESVFECVGG